MLNSFPFYLSSAYNDNYSSKGPMPIAGYNVTEELRYVDLDMDVSRQISISRLSVVRILFLKSTKFHSTKLQVVIK